MPAADDDVAANRLVTVLQLSGPQRTRVRMQHAGTDEAVVTVQVGQVLWYLKTRATAERLAQVWDEAGDDAQLLPRRGLRRRARGARSSGWAEPSVVVHTGGVPPCGSRVLPVRDRTGRPIPGTAEALLVRIGDVQFEVQDQEAFRSCDGVFAAVARQVQHHLPKHDMRLRPARRAKAKRTSPGGHSLDQAELDAAVDGHRLATRIAEATAQVRYATAELDHALAAAQEAGPIGIAAILRAAAATGSIGAAATTSSGSPAVPPPPVSRAGPGIQHRDPPTQRGR